MENKQKNTFPKAEHLKSRKQIEQLFAGGKSFFVHPLKVYWHFSEKGNADGRPKMINDKSESCVPVKVGVSASKRNFKKAVDRNLVKRLLRETYRLHKQELIERTSNSQQMLEVFFIYVDKTLPTFEALEVKMKTCVKKLQKMVEEKL